MSKPRKLAGYAWAVAATAISTVAGLAMAARFDPVNIAMVYLLAVVVIALRFSYGPAILASITSVAALDYLFVPPLGHFAVGDAQYLLTFAIVLIVALVISNLVESIRLPQPDQDVRAALGARRLQMASEAASGGYQ